MINQYPLILIVLLAGVLYALPNIYGEDPAVQITTARAGELDTALAGSVLAALDNAGISYQSLESDEQQILVRFSDTEAQLTAVDYIKAALGKDYVVALNLAPATPEWLQAINALPMYLGLDLRGGVHFLMEVDMNAAAAKAEAWVMAVPSDKVAKKTPGPVSDTVRT